ncbi:lactate utilization protein [Anaerosolibacter sp.]|uniref:lactate utilization protein n=1 Tax=Anaerosolibacter sp. TaxID=1872527 RepID=UPI0039F0BC55
MGTEIIDKIITNLGKRNIAAEYFHSLEETKQRILDLIPTETSIGIGNSQTLKAMAISQTLSSRGNVVYDKTFAKTKEESKRIKKESLLAEWYITGTNAISSEGHIVNIDHSGNRVAAMIYGPEKVIIVVGTNKITDSLDAAIQRSRTHAAPLNARRAGFNPPCVQLKKCVDCKTDDRVCYNLVVIEGQYVKDRMKVFIVDENLGY